MSVKRALRLGFCPEGNGAPGNIFPLDEIFKETQNIAEKGVEGCDAVVFWGGTDINPRIYNQKPGPHTHFGGTTEEYSRRDTFELRAMTACKANDIPMIGICRGAQLMCAFEGGTLIQDVTGHGKDHLITAEIFPNIYKTVTTTSSHHQMMNPKGTIHEVIAWTSCALSSHYWGETHAEVTDRYPREPEIVYFPRCRGLAIQGHPEWCRDVSDDFASLCNLLIRQRLLNAQVVPA